MTISISTAGQYWQAQPVPPHNDLKQKLILEKSHYEQDIASLTSSDDTADLGKLYQDYQKLSQAEVKLAQINSQPDRPQTYQKPQTPPPTDEEMNLRFGSAYNVDISSLQTSKTMTSATPELEAPSHL